MRKTTLAILAIMLLAMAGCQNGTDWWEREDWEHPFTGTWTSTMTSYNNKTTTRILKFTGNNWSIRTLTYTGKDGEYTTYSGTFTYTADTITFVCNQPIHPNLGTEWTNVWCKHTHVVDGTNLYFETAKLPNGFYYPVYGIFYR